MRPKYCSKQIRLTSLAMAIAAAGFANAGTEVAETSIKPMAEASSSDVVSGILKLDFNSHYVSYGYDAWSNGASLSEPTFNPSLELAFALPNDVTFTLGTWWDMNSNANSRFGGRLQEVDVWAGLSKSFDKLTVSAAYQAWMYGGTTEDIIDVKFAYDTFLAPSLTLHNRLDAGAAQTGSQTGTVAVLGLSHGVEAGPISISFPLNVAYFVEDEYHAGDEGFGYASVGVAAALPLAPYIGEAYGDWTLNAGVTYFATDDEVIPNNDEDNFVTTNLGLALSF